MELNKSYKKIKYKDLQDVISDEFKKSGKTEFDIASALKVSSQQTVKNIFNYNEQVVSDKILSKTLSYLKINASVLWNNGERVYIIED